MSAISSWILSIAGVVCLSILIELVMPDGQMNKYLKSIFSFVVVLVIISPIPKLLKNNFDIDSILNYDYTYSVDSNYLYQINLNKLDALKLDIENEAETAGYLNTEVYINANIFNDKLDISSVYVDLSNLVISENAEHKNITKVKKHINSIIMKHISIREELIVYE